MTGRLFKRIGPASFRWWAIHILGLSMVLTALPRAPHGIRKTTPSWTSKWARMWALACSAGTAVRSSLLACVTRSSIPIRIRTGVHTRRISIPGNAFHGTAELARKFAGIGPSLSWNGSAPVVGNTQVGTVSFDLGATAAFLFGRQKVSGNHQTNEHIRPFREPFYLAYAQSSPVTHDRAIAVPSFGGAAAVTYRLRNVRFRSAIARTCSCA